VTVNVAVALPAVTVTDVGTVSIVLVFVSATVLPPAGAAWLSVTVQLLVPLGPRVVGLHASVVTTVGATRLMVICELFPNVAVTVPEWLVVKLPVVALNVAVVDPAGAVTDVGTVNAVFVLASATVAPPAGAAWLSVTVQLLVPLGPRVVGAHTKAVTCRGVNVIVTLCEPPPSVAVTVAD
jgi:hypothetical protein